MRGLEGKIQKGIIDKLESKGYFVINLIKTNQNGIPDLLALKDGEKPLFIEVKQPGKEASILQKWRIGYLQKLGFTAFVADSLDQVLTRIK